MNDLALCLSERYKQLGREVPDLHAQGHPSRAVSLNNFAINPCSRYKQLGSMQDLDDAIVLHREALDLSPQGHPDLSARLNDLAARFSTRYNQLGAMQDLDGVLSLAEMYSTFARRDTLTGGCL